jgi:hypothetical protein
MLYRHCFSTFLLNTQLARSKVAQERHPRTRQPDKTGLLNVSISSCVVCLSSLKHSQHNVFLNTSTFSMQPHADTDWGVCFFSWLWFEVREADRPSPVTRNRRIPFKITLGWNAVVFCACEIIQIFSIVFCVARAVYKFDFRLVVAKTTSCSDRHSCFG